ncbi:MAG: ester cyclase [Flavobacteriales bacterium]|nr:ester cyclase [Flavobacteriales bacterium]MCB9168691.1 ester cyclase [Flavobacteriales bacterium]
MNTGSLTLAAGLSGLLLLAACGGPPPDPMAAKNAAAVKADSAAKAMVAAQEETFRKIFEMFNTGNTEGIEDLVAADFVDHQQPPEITTTGIQGARDVIAYFRSVMPDLHQEMIRTATNGDISFVHYHMSGTFTGPMGEMPPNGKKMDVMGVDVVRFADGKMVEHWGYIEEMKMMQQLGMMPPPDAAAKKK